MTLEQNPDEDKEIHLVSYELSGKPLPKLVQEINDQVAKELEEANEKGPVREDDEIRLVSYISKER